MQVTLNKAGRNIVSNAHVIQKESLLTIKQMAEATNLSTSTIRRMSKARKERRTYNPMFSTVVKLAQATQVSVDDLVSGKLDVK